MLGAAMLSGCVTTGGGIGGSGVVPDPGLVDGVAPKALLEPLKGGLVAGPAGEGLSDAEKLRAVAAEYRALETAFGAPPTLWSDDRSGNAGEVVAAVPYRVGRQDCRSYTHVVQVKRESRSASGAACRQPDGAWLRLE
jgi:surface antigen